MAANCEGWPSQKVPSWQWPDISKRSLLSVLKSDGIFPYISLVLPQSRLEGFSHLENFGKFKGGRWNQCGIC